MTLDPDFIFSLFFFAFAALLVISALRVITVPNPVHAALFLVLAFFSASGIWMLLKAEFLSLILILVYVGAVMVLFLFVVMMLDINIDKLREGFWEYLPMAGTIGLLMIVEMGMVLAEKNLRPSQAVTLPPNYSNTAELGKVLYTDYLLPFELAAVVLLVAMIAAIVLTLRDRKDSKSMNPADQVKVKRNDRLRIISMPAEVEPVAPEEGK